MLFDGIAWQFEAMTLLSFDWRVFNCTIMYGAVGQWVFQASIPVFNKKGPPD